MTTLIHILGADIPHHNQTLLRFFNEHLAAGNVQARQFMLVTSSPTFAAAFPALTLRCYPNQKSLAHAVVARARANRDQRFMLHGQFNARLWLALLTGSLRAAQVSWHIWGADLYETATTLRYRLFYRLRRLAQRRVACVFATRGDLHYFARHHPMVTGKLLYFPANMPALPQPTPSEKSADAPLTVLVGNSGDRSNQHIAALQAIHRQLGANVKPIIPMGYPPANDAYIQQVQRAGNALFGAEQLTILRQTLTVTDYQQLLHRCDLGYFLFARQQGIGTLCLLLQANIPCVLHRDNPFWRDMQEQQLLVLFADQPLSRTLIRAARQQLQQTDKSQLVFYSPGCLPLWQQALRYAATVQQEST